MQAVEGKEANTLVLVDLIGIRMAVAGATGKTVCPSPTTIAAQRMQSFGV